MLFRYLSASHFWLWVVFTLLMLATLGWIANYMREEIDVYQNIYQTTGVIERIWRNKIHVRYYYAGRTCRVSFPIFNEFRQYQVDENVQLTISSVNPSRVWISGYWARTYLLGVLVLIVFGVVVGGFLFVCILKSVLSLRRSLRRVHLLNTGESVPGRVERIGQTDKARWRFKDKEPPTRVFYSWICPNGNRCEGKSLKIPAKLAARWNPGDEVTVYMAPNDPECAEVDIYGHIKKTFPTGFLPELNQSQRAFVKEYLLAQWGILLLVISITGSLPWLIDAIPDLIAAIPDLIAAIPKGLKIVILIAIVLVASFLAGMIGAVLNDRQRRKNHKRPQEFFPELKGNPLVFFSKCSSVAQRVILLLVVSIVVYLVAVNLTYYFQISNLELSDVYTFWETQKEIEKAEKAYRIQFVFGIYKAWIIFWAVVFFLVWIHRAYQNLLTFNVQNLKYSPRWAVIAFFIPFANLVIPYQVIKEILKASHPKADTSAASSWRNTSTPRLIGWAWFLALTCVFLVFVRFIMSNQEPIAFIRKWVQFSGWYYKLYPLGRIITSPECYLVMSWLSVVSYYLNIVLIFLTIRMIIKVDVMQQEKSKRLISRETPS